MKWHKSYIGDVCLVGDGAHAKIQRQAEGILYLTCKNFKQGQLDLSKVDYISEEDYEKYFKKESKALTKPQVNDILFSIIGTLGERYIYKEQDYFGISSSVSILRPFLNKVYPLFLFYWIKSNTFQKALYGIKGGVAQGYVSLDMIRALPIHYPDDIAIQHKIADILSKYDDLIENNRRRIELLEESARLLYREWFVYLRFPGHEHTPIIDGIPEGWEKGKISDLGEVITGKTPSKQKTSNFDGKIPFVKTPDMHNQVLTITTQETLSEEGANSQSKKFIPRGSVMVSCIGTVGIVSMSSSTCQTNQQINSIVFSDKLLAYYSFFLLKDSKPRLEAMGGGSTMPNINKQKFNSIPILISSKQLIDLFAENVKPSFEQIEKLSLMNQKLQQARDILLPRLMNGEIAV
jgi:type I restriction enzyme S subunit